MMLCGCATKLTADDQVKLINAFSNAGCAGSISAGVTGGTGQVGGGITGHVDVNGTCDPAKKPTTVLAVDNPITK